MNKYYILDSEQKPSGPYDLAELAKMVSSGSLPTDVQCCQVGKKDWKKLSEAFIPSPPKTIPDGDRVTWRLVGAFSWAVFWRAGIVQSAVLMFVQLLSLHTSLFATIEEPFLSIIVALLSIPLTLVVFKGILVRGYRGYRIRIYQTSS